MNIRRMKSVIKRLRALDVERFYLGHYCNSRDLEDLKHNCGTSACVIGWMPVWYPRSWRLDFSRFPGLRYGSKSRTLDGAEHWFGLSEEQCERLFTLYGYKSDDPSPTLVANKMQRELYKYLKQRNAK